MQPNIQNTTDFPPELCAKPLALVGISGLDIVNNAIHKSIWETFSSNRRVERAPVLFKLIGNAHEFPVVKPKRSSYDWYIPKGILKKNWLIKHLYEIPAVTVIFYDLDWSDPQWNEKMIECASRVQSLRAALEGRACRLAVVLIQNCLPLPAGEDALAAERAVALCSSCELNSQSLFVLPHGDHLQGYAVRLESAFYEFAQIYYHNEAKHIKSHKDHLNKNTHQYLFVRHQFKLGVLYELKQDVHSSYKHYTHAYNSLLEIRIVDTNALEIRTIAGFLNYKLCKLLFALNLPRDAISQFKSHIDRFKARLGFHVLSFEHYSWLSKQIKEEIDMDNQSNQTLITTGVYFLMNVRPINRRRKREGFFATLIKGMQTLEWDEKQFIEYSRMNRKQFQYLLNCVGPHIQKDMKKYHLSPEHRLMITLQYSIFGDIFDEAVKLGLPAVQTQHPGLYYQQAAQYALMRKKACQELCSDIMTYPQPDPLEGAIHMEFFGQRPWRSGKISTEPPDPPLESNGIQALQFLERQVNHSNVIIALYGLAITQYKTYRCPRTRRHLVLQMADEYFDSKDYGKALTLYTHMLWDFRSEKWWSIISQILEKALKCAYLTANIQDYVLLAIEFLGTDVVVNLDEKRRVYENLTRILKKQIPYGNLKLPQEILQSAIILWQPVFTERSLRFSLDISNIGSCIATKGRFTKTTYEVDQNVTVEVYVRSTCPFPLTFSRVSVTVNTQGYSSEFAVTNLENISLGFHKDEVKKFLVVFMADSSDINKEIQIGSVNLLLGNPSECCLDLKYNSLNETTGNHIELTYFKYSPDQIDFDNIQLSPKATVVPRESKLKVEFDHDDPAFLGEWYEIKVRVVNEELFGIIDLQVEVGLEEEIIGVEMSLKPESSRAKQSIVLTNAHALEQGEQLDFAFFIRSSLVCKFKIQVKLAYTLNREKPVLSSKTEIVALSVVEPFEVSTKYLSLLMGEIDRFYVGEEFGVMKYLTFPTPWSIVIEDTFFKYTSPVRSAEKAHDSQLMGKVFNTGEVGAELHLATCDKTFEHNSIIGQYTIKWKRQNGHSTVTNLHITGLSCDWIPLGLKSSMPAHGYLKTPMILIYHIENRSSDMIQLEVAMETSETFMFAGYKQFEVKILPHSVKTFQYNLNPLIAGNVALPKLLLKIQENDVEDDEFNIIGQESLDSLIQRSLSTNIYIMPQTKGQPKLPAVLTPRKIIVN